MIGRRLMGENSSDDFPWDFAIAELLTRVNYGIRTGNFEIAYSDGEIRD
jgi:hypothetical protein